MRKGVCFLVCVALVSGGLPLLAACEKGEGRTRYQMAAEYFPEERCVRADMAVSFYNDTENALSSLEFFLFPNAFCDGGGVTELAAPSVYYNGKSAGGVEITSCNGGEFTVEGTRLTVTLPEEVFPDERAEISLSFSTTLPMANYRFGVGERAVNLAHFYPVLYATNAQGFCVTEYSPLGDPFFAEVADYEVSIALPLESTLALAGVSPTEKDGKAVYHFTRTGRDIALFFGKFECVSSTEFGIPLSYYYIEDEEPTFALTVAGKALKYYEGKFGEYYGKDLTLVQTDLYGGGMEYSGLCALSPLYCKDAALIAHEVAHQWWYASVGSDQVDNAWMDEGLAEFSACLFLGTHAEYGETYEELVSACRSACRTHFSVRSQLDGEVDVSMRRPLSSFAGEYDYATLVYRKGVVLFDSLKNMIGEKRFFAGLSRYAKTYRGRIASPEELIACFPSAGAERLFASFLEGKTVV